jgi:predicted anti-sigma-YlaC factor YlaD
MTTPGARDLTCQALVELVTDYLEGALSPADGRRIDEHLSGCPYCRIYLEQMRQTIRTLGHLREGTLSPDTLQALQALFRGWCR